MNVPELSRTPNDASGGLVVLRLTISEEGRVIEAAVEQGLAEGIDEQVRQAALGFEFAPATRDESPLSVTVLFPVDVPPDDAPTCEPSQPAGPDRGAGRS